MKRFDIVKRSVTVLPCIVAALVLTGCGGRLGDFTFLTSKRFNLPVTTMQERARVTGEDCARNILFFTIGHVQPSTKEAIDQAIEKEDANALIDAVVEWEWFQFIIFGANCIKVEGTAVQIE